MNGGAEAVSVCGPSGIGKSALIRRFLGQFGTRGDVVVLSGRCYENESVPYKALDGVVDDLSRYLASIPRRQVERLIPPDLPALTRVFPVLLQVDAIADTRREQEPGSLDPLSLRRRAFEALRELLGRLADRRSLVVWIDDLQWADADSALLLEELLRPPSRPSMLTLLCFRSEETAAKPFLQVLLDRAGHDAWSAVLLEPMTDEEALRLIGELLPADLALTVDDTRRMTREAGGSPFVLEQLARYAGVNRAESHQAPTFTRMFDRRFSRLSLEARRFLETLAICGRPMAPDLICDACGVARARQSLVGMLRSAHFIRSSGSSERVETYHDRIREELAAQVGPDAVRRIHRLMVQRSSRSEATTARRCSNTIGAPETTKTRRFRPVSRPPRQAPHSPSIAPPSSIGRPWRRGRSRPRLQPGGKDSPTPWLTPAGRPRPLKPTSSRPTAQVIPGVLSSNGAQPSSSLSADTSIGAGPDSQRARGSGHASLAQPARHAVLVAVGDAYGFGGADCASFQSVLTKSTRMHSFVWTPAGRRRPDWPWWM